MKIFKYLYSVHLNSGKLMNTSPNNEMNDQFGTQCRMVNKPYDHDFQGGQIGLSDP